MSVKIERIYTDGACSGNPGPGGWGTLICYENGDMHELGGAAPQTTNNRMEMQAAIAGLTFLLAAQQSDPVKLYTDSEYVIKGITQWIKGWKQRGWVNAAKKPVLNRDLWETLDQLTGQVNGQLRRPLEWVYVRGHAGDPGNERCDTIARAFATGRRISLVELPS
jgi:ribonuclease HI